ncbi:MAG TPA: type II toxin-antitoxin system VapC family toxin [Longimicrobium sp.]|nr:type II toxin-antitoxin system VapC family toxin [Longimicrobium sp.]
MRYLVDTNFISEVSKPAPNAGVVEWANAGSPLDLAVSTITLGEIQKGISVLPISQKRTTLEAWLEATIRTQFRGRVLSVDENVALEWGRLAAAAKSQGRPLATADGLILATAAVHALTIVTRNERDFIDRGVPVLNPWTE